MKLYRVLLNRLVIILSGSFLFFSAMVSILISASAQAETQGGISIDHAWIRFTPGNSPMAGYFLLKNNSTRDVELCGASSSAFGRTMIHQSVVKDGQDSMMMLRGCLAVAAGKSLSFAPGGYHIMLMKRHSEIKVGDTETIDLKFKNLGDIAVKFAVKPIGFEGY